MRAQIVQVILTLTVLSTNKCMKKKASPNVQKVPAAPPFIANWTWPAAAIFGPSAHPVFYLQLAPLNLPSPKSYT